MAGLLVGACVHRYHDVRCPHRKSMPVSTSATGGRQVTAAPLPRRHSSAVNNLRPVIRPNTHTSLSTVLTYIHRSQSSGAMNTSLDCPKLNTPSLDIKHHKHLSWSCVPAYTSHLEEAGSSFCLSHLVNFICRRLGCKQKQRALQLDQRTVVSRSSCAASNASSPTYTMSRLPSPNKIVQHKVWFVTSTYVRLMVITEPIYLYVQIARLYSYYYYIYT
jgi:hypothetical protein